MNKLFDLDLFVFSSTFLALHIKVVTEVLFCVLLGVSWTIQVN